MLATRGYDMPGEPLDLCSFGVLSGVTSLRLSTRCSLHAVE